MACPPRLTAPDPRATQQREQFIGLVLQTRQALQTLYAQELPADTLRQRKAQTFERMRDQYRLLRDQHWAANTRFDPWINSPMNNAKLLPFGLYDQWVPAFAALFQQSGNDWQTFYAAVEHLAKLPLPARKTALRQLAAHAAA